IDNRNCECSINATLTANRLHCLADLPPAIKPDLLPTCQSNKDCRQPKDSLYKSVCHAGRCHGQVGFYMRRPAVGDAICVQIDCTTEKNQCGQFNWTCDR